MVVLLALRSLWYLWLMCDSVQVHLSFNRYLELFYYLRAACILHCKNTTFNDVAPRTIEMGFIRIEEQHRFFSTSSRCRADHKVSRSGRCVTDPLKQDFSASCMILEGALSISLDKRPSQLRATVSTQSKLCDRHLLQLSPAPSILN